MIWCTTQVNPPLLSTAVEHVVDGAWSATTEVLVSDHEQVWTATAQLLRAQVSEAVWLSTFQDAAALPGVGSPFVLTVSKDESVQICRGQVGWWKVHVRHENSELDAAY